jgi:hypothetical protein
MIRARLVNALRRVRPHPAAITRREESKRAKEARVKRDAAQRRAAMIHAGLIEA